MTLDVHVQTWLGQKAKGYYNRLHRSADVV